MAREPYDDDTEYQLNEDEEAIYPQEDDEEEQAEGAEEVVEPSEHTRKISKKKIIYTVIFLVLMALVAYKLITLIFSAENSASKQVVPEISVPSVMKAPLDALPKTVQPIKKKVVMPIPKVSDKPVVGEEQADLKKVISADQAEITKLQQSSQQIMSSLQQQNVSTQNRMSDLDRKITNLENRLGNVQSSLSELVTSVKAMENAQKAAVRRRANAARVHARVIRHAKRYFVKAVIPGRAWLKGADGSARTIAIGDRIPGYGKVRAIDAYTGVVTTSSGIMIRYGINN